MNVTLDFSSKYPELQESQEAVDWLKKCEKLINANLPSFDLWASYGIAEIEIKSEVEAK